MRLQLWVVAIFLTLFAHLPGAEASEILIVASVRSPLSKVSLDAVKNAFLGRPARIDGGIELAAVDRSETPHRVRETFYQRVIARSMTEIKAYWSEMIFTGHGTPPPQSESLQDLKKRLASQPHAIGYIHSSEDPAELKIVQRVSVP